MLMRVTKDIVCKKPIVKFTNEIKDVIVEVGTIVSIERKPQGIKVYSGQDEEAYLGLTSLENDEFLEVHT